MQRFIIFFITVYALHFSGGSSAHRQELKNCKHSIWYAPGLLDATASVGELELNHISLAHIICCVYSFWAPDDGRRNRPKHEEHWQW